MGRIHIIKYALICRFILVYDGSYSGGPVVTDYHAGLPLSPHVDHEPGYPYRNQSTSVPLLSNMNSTNHTRVAMDALVGREYTTILPERGLFVFKDIP